MYQNVYNLQNAAADVDIWSILAVVATITTAIVAIRTARQAIEQYKRQILEKRAQQFLELRKSYRENAVFQCIIKTLHDKGDFSSIHPQDRIEFAGFFEDAMFLANSNLIESTVVYYMFGGDAINAWDSEGFWAEDIKTDKNFALLTDFVQEARAYKAGDVATQIRAARL